MIGDRVAGPGRYVHALRFRWANALYDPVASLFLRERTFRSRLIGELDPCPGQRILDVGCGTGTLALMIRNACPEATVVGVDGDGEILRIARRKAAGTNVSFHESFASDLPFRACTFDAVVTTLMLHHLDTREKLATFSAVRRVLVPGGRLHVADWGRPSTFLMRLAFLGIRLLDGFEPTRDNVDGRLPELMMEAGLADAVETGSMPTVFGTLSFYRARAS